MAFLFVAFCFPAAAWDKTSDDLTLGTIGIGFPSYTPNTSWQGSSVYYGKYNDAPMKYRVLSPSTAAFGGITMFLDCHTILAEVRFDNDGKPHGEFMPNEWAHSDVRAWLNGENFLNNTNAFTAQERTAIAVR